jgi:hypothetical protein
MLLLLLLLLLLLALLLLLLLLLLAVGCFSRVGLAPADPEDLQELEHDDSLLDNVLDVLELLLQQLMLIEDKSDGTRNGVVPHAGA